MNKILFMILFLICNSFVALALTESELSNIATERFRSVVSIEYQNEFRLVTVERQETPRYLFIWQRFVNDIPMVEDRYGLFIYINGSLDIESYKFSVPASQIDTTYSLSQDQAKWILQQRRWRIETEPRLMYKDGKVVWDMNVEGCEMGIDAKNGNITIYGCATGTAPIDTAFTFSTTEYYISAYGIYILFGVALVGGIFYYKKYLLASKRK